METVSGQDEAWDAMRFHASLLSEIPSGVVACDASGAVTYANLAAEEMTGRSAAEMLGERAAAVIGLSGGDEDQIGMAVLASGRWVGEVWLTRNDGSDYPASMSMVALSFGTDMASGELIVWSDVTARIAAEQDLAAAYAQLELVLGAGPAVIYRDRAEPGFPNVFTTSNVRDILGLEPEDVAATRYVERIHEADRDRVIDSLTTLLETGRSVSEYRFLHGDGSYHWLRDENRVVAGPNGAPAEVVGYLADISDQHRLMEERTKLAAAMDQTTDGVVMTDPLGTITYANASFGEMSGRSTDDLVGSAASELAPGHLAPIYARAIGSVLGGERWAGSATVSWKQGEPIDVDVAVWPLVLDGEVTNILAVFRDVTVEHRLGEELRQQRDQRDTLVQSFSRLRSGATVEETAAAVANELISVTGVDLVAVLGASNGSGLVRVAGSGKLDVDVDALLHGCSAYLRERMAAGRLEDADEHHAAHQEASCTWSSTALQVLHVEPLFSDGNMVGALVVGSASLDAKRELRELSTFFGEYAAVAAALIGPGWDDRRRSSDMAGTIREILASRAFHSVFQPVRELSTRTVVGYEALTRFADATPPEVRFAQAISVSLGDDLEEATLTSALTGAARLPDGPWLSLNVSPHLINEKRRLARLLRGRGDRKIVIEVTEHAVVDDYAALRRVVKNLGDGIEIAVDDAGAGFASLRHIAELRPRYVKLDMGLVRGVVRDPARQGLVAGLVHFASETGCVLIAEGIETDAEFRALRRLGVTFGQGYLLGRPVPAGEDPAARANEGRH